MQDMELKKSFHTAAHLLPERLWRAVYTLDEQQQTTCEEIRVRLGRPLAVTVAGRTVLPCGARVLPEKQELEELLARATECSVHTYLEQLRQGYLTTRFGHRLGLCGEAVLEGGTVKTFRGYSSVNIRLARQIPGLGEQLPLWDEHGCINTLIAAPAGGGKTTLLRELCRRLSQRYRVAVADERYEIAACMDGTPRFQVGNCDVASGGSKHEVLTALLRAMSPEVLAVDEITAEEDSRELLQCFGCGCGLLATAHGGSMADLRRRPTYRMLLEQGVFRQVIFIGQENGLRVYRAERTEAAT